MIHTYDPERVARHLVDDKPVVSVTELLKSMGVIDQKGFDEFHAQRGKAVHKATEIIDKGQALDWETVDSRIHGYLKAYKMFKELTSFSPSAVEIPLFSDRLGVATCIDRIGTLNGTPSIVEIKTGTKSRWHLLQTALQFQIALDNKINVAWRRALYLRTDGTFKIEPHDDISDLSAAEALVWGYHAKIKYGGNNGTNGNA